MQTTLTRIFQDLHIFFFIFILLESVSHGLSENSDQNSRKARKFEGFFRPKSGGLQKKKKRKKKRSSPKLSPIFRPKSETLTFEGGLFSYGGGAIFNFSQKIGLKSIKNVRFCILHKPMGGLEPPRPPPPPGYATGYKSCYCIMFITKLDEGLRLQLLGQKVRVSSG